MVFSLYFFTMNISHFYLKSMTSSKKDILLLCTCPKFSLELGKGKSLKMSLLSLAEFDADTF